MGSTGRRGVLVGFDGGAASRAALRAAGAEAARRGAHLSVVLVSPPTGARTSEDLPDPGLVARTAARVSLDAALTALRTRHRGLAVQGWVADGPAGPVLADWGRGADLLVLGRSRRRPVTGTALTHVLRTGPCPVLTVTAPSGPRMRTELLPGPLRRSVLLGARPGTEHASVLRAATAEAARRGTSLSVVHATSRAEDADGEVHRSLVGRSTATAAAAGVVLRCRTHHGEPATVLLDASADAEVLVLGHRRRRPWEPLGAVAASVLHRSAHPVLVVPLDA